MAISKSVILLFIVTWSSSSVYVGHSQGGGPMTCVQNMMPCQQYMKEGSSSPSAACCGPLKQILDNDRQCLCTLFTDPVLMKSLNVMQDDVINLANSCGAHADSSLCKTAAAPGASSTNSSATSTQADKPNAATSMTHVGSFFSLAPIFSFIVFAF